MKKIAIILLSIISPILASCQSNKKIDYTRKIYQNKKFSPNEWEDLLAKFPERNMNFLLDLNNVKNLKDTISRQLLHDYFWNDTLSIAEPHCKTCPMSVKYIMVTTAYKSDDISYPIGSMPPLSNRGSICGLKNGKEGNPNYRVYPLGKITLQNQNQMIFYGYPQMGEGFFMVTAFVLNKNYEKVGRFGFMYSDVWKHCDDTIQEIMKGSEPLSAPMVITENGFTLKDKMVDMYYEETITESMKEVRIREDGKFEIYKDKKTYEDGTVKLWSKKGYEIKDIEGFTNFREKPSVKSKSINKLSNGTKLEILNAKNDWWKVKVGKKEGYIHKSRIIEGI